MLPCVGLNTNRENTIETIYDHENITPPRTMLFIVAAAAIAWDIVKRWIGEISRAFNFH